MHCWKPLYWFHQNCNWW